MSAADHLPADVRQVAGGGTIRHAPLPYDDILRLCRGVALSEDPETWLFTTPEHASMFAEVMAGRGWHFGAPTFTPRQMFPRHNITLLGGPA